MGWGDDLMVSGRARCLHALVRGKIAIVSRSGGRPVWSPLWQGLDYIAQPDEDAIYSIVDSPACRPYRWSVNSTRSIWREYAPVPARIRFSRAEEDRAEGCVRGFVVVEPNVKTHRYGAENKNWGWDRYQGLVNSLKQIRWVQLGPPGVPLLAGVTHVPTASFREACGILARADAFVGPEGGLHHASAAVGTPAVVIFGGYISPKVTGYTQHANLFTGEHLGCGMHSKCHCECMQKIAVGEVAAALLSTRVSECAAATERRSCQLSTGAPQEVEWGRMGYNEHSPCRKT